MDYREQFGQFLLLKKLREDPLGETFRAARVGAGNLENVVLFRIFNGPGIDGSALWKAMSARAGVYQALRSPNVGAGVELGEVRGIPFVA